jgi:DNA-binding MarR family transcriptional regulator
MAPRPGSPQLTLQLRLIVESMSRAGRPLYPQQLTEALRYAAPSVFGTISRLETAGYVREVDEPADAPRYHGGPGRRWFELTDEGQHFADELRPTTRELVAAHARSVGMDLSL